MLYICEKNNDKYGVKNTNDNSIKYYNIEEIKEINKTTKIFGVLKGGNCIVRNIDEFQTLNWENCNIFSFVDKDKKEITVGVEEKETNKILHYCYTDCYLEESQMKSFSKNKNGDLEWIFKEGVNNKCAGICVWLDYGYDTEMSDSICFELFLIKYPDNTIEEVAFEHWDFNETGGEYVYNEETDTIEYEY